MGTPRNQHANERENVESNKEKNRWWQNREEFFLNLFEYLVHGTSIVDVECHTRKFIRRGDGMAGDSYKIGPSIAMVLFQSRRVIGHWGTISAVTGWEQA